MNGSSGMWIFAVAAGKIVLLFAASLYWAGRRDGSRRQALGLALCAPVLVIAGYVALGQPAALEPAPAQAPMPDQDQINAMVQRLADRLKENPEDLDGWLLLGRSYAAQGRYADAAAAYERAQTRVMQDGDLLVNWINLRLIVNNQKFDARTLELLDAASRLAPDDPNVALFRAFAAFDRGDKAGAGALVAKLRERYPPGTPERQDLEDILESRLPAIGAAGKQ
jgi:cytochrome c-type biogenesis protein CcmH